MNAQTAAVSQADATDATLAVEARFLAGGGESGARMRAVDWSRTALGPPEHWPRSLKTIVRMMLDSRYAMWMLWGPELTFFCNDAYLPTVGIRRDWVMGARSDKVWAEIWADISPRIEQVLKRGESTWDEGLLLFLERSGFPEETYHTFSYSPVYDDDSRIAGMLCVVTEVTERVLGERGLTVLRDLATRTPRASSVSESLERLMGVLERVPLDVPFASLYLVDETRACLKLSAQFGHVPEALRMVERPLDAGNGDVVSEVLRDGQTQVIDLGRDPGSSASPLWPDPVTRAVVQPVQGAKAQAAAVLIMGASPRRQLDDNYRRFFELVGGQFASVLADAQAYENERQRAEALAALDRAKTKFFSNVSHEFRTPLTLMLGPLEEALAETPPNQAMRERLQLAQRNALRLLRLVNSLLDFSRIEAGRMQAAYEPTDMGTLTQDLASNFRSAIERAGLRLTVNAAPLPAPVFLDREMWEKIVLNLLSNAYKFTLQGQIEVRVGAQDSVAVLEVIDTGIGVPEEALPRLFERFYRVDQSGGRTHEGSGIGLALVQELVRLHGGSITVESRLGTGTTFRVEVPFGSVHLPAEKVRTAGTAIAGTSATAYVQEALRWEGDPDAPPVVVPEPLADRRFASTFGARVLLADDNRDMRAYVAGLFSPNYRVEAVSDGEALIEAARRERPDVIVSDVMMPRLDGFGLIQALRRDENLRDLPVILLSARAGEEARIEGLDAGADDYLVKPFSARELLARVGALLERTRLHRQIVEEQRVAQASAQRRTAQFETLLIEAPLGVYLLDSELRIREVNPTARPVFGDIPQLVGADFRAVLRRLWEPAFAEEVIAIFERTLATGEPYFMPERIEKRADRQAIEAYEWQINRIPLPEGDWGVVCYFRDISQQVRVRLQLENADRQKDEFLAMLAHELRNPLAPIRTASELLKRTQQPDERAQTAIDIVKRQVNHLTRLVDDLLDISRITRARIELKRRDVSLGDIVSQALETVEPMLREKHHHVSTTADLTPLVVNGDPARLVQCVANLLTNAIKYTDPDGVIRIETRTEGDEAVISVTDNGTGIAADLLPQIFDLFVQSKRTLDRAQGGLGIGLSVVKRLVEMHGGSVTASSAGIGQGATFTIRLPRVTHKAVAEPNVGAPRAPARRTLVVDDNHDAAESLAMLLSLDGHEVQAVFSAEEALKRAQSFQPQVMLLDIGLPGMDGYEVARRVRALDGGAQIRLIALTGYGQNDDRQRALAAGFDEHLVKPVEPEKLAQTLARS
jgi:signal transduction histidine kinase